MNELADLTENIIFVINYNNEIFNSYFKKIISNEINIKYLYKFKSKSRIRKKTILKNN
jgi:hypothetical protein